MVCLPLVRVTWRRQSHRKPVSRVLPSLDMGRKDRGTHSHILRYKDTLVLHTVQSHWDVYVTPGLALALVCLFLVDPLSPLGVER